MGFEKKIEKRHIWDKEHLKPYHLSDLERLWFSLNAKYVAHCWRHKEPWMAEERNVRVIEWSKGLINKDNIANIRQSYEDFAKSGKIADNFEFDWEKFVSEMM